MVSCKLWVFIAKACLTMVHNVNAVDPIGVVKVHIKSANDLKNVEAIGKYQFH